MFTFAFACFLSVFTIAVFYRYTREGKSTDLILFFICGPLLLLFHLFAALIVAIPLAAILILNLRDRSKRYLLIFLLWIVWILICNSFWILPFISFRHYTRQFAAGEFRMEIIRNLFVFRGGLRPLALWLFFGLFGILSWKRDQRILRIAYLTVIVFFLFLGFIGSWVHPVIDALEPHRFIIALKCLLIIPAAIAVTATVGIVRSRTIRFVILLIVLASLVALMPLTGRLAARLPEKANQLIGFLQERTDPSGRILVQNSDAKHPDIYFGTHLLFFPLYMDIEQIGGPPGRVPLKHHFAEFQHNQLFGKPLSAFSEDELKEYLNLYNVKWLVVWSDGARAYFGKLTEQFTLLGKVRYSKYKKFYIFEAHRAPDFFIRGAGMVAADFNRITITDASPGEIILKYHWLETLKTDPEVELEPVMMLDDPVPFIKLNNPGYDVIKIYN
jgi:hypothetical protein